MTELGGVSRTEAAPNLQPRPGRAKLQETWRFEAGSISRPSNHVDVYDKKVSSSARRQDAASFAPKVGI